jgi:hypothetical protein
VNSPPVLAASHDSAFLHLVRTLLNDLDLCVRTTMEWHAVPHLAAKLLPAAAILDLAPSTETACWLTLEALRNQPITRNIRILLCPVAPWLIEEHRQQIDRLDASTWSGSYDLQDLLRFVASAVTEANPIAGVSR